MRKITEIIVHCSATPEGRPVTVEDIDLWHRERGFRCIGYHYVIYLDGTVHPGRPVSEPGAHCTGHNANSIGVCYVGGCDAAMNPKDTRTPAQKEALRTLIRKLLNVYPGATVHGHREFANKDCPSFDVATEL
ncbi:MAG: N-acetylmuramoyl-L-alanine amidase [Bacteroidales bacterium]|nr:N-acetylmuramoyl-L-alanine amidase [Bacteroidales bacterium]